MSRVSAAAWRPLREHHPADQSPPQLPDVVPGMGTAQGLADDCCHSLWSLEQALVILCKHTSNLFVKEPSNSQENEILIACRLKNRSSYSKAKNVLPNTEIYSNIYLFKCNIFTFNVYCMFLFFNQHLENEVGTTQYGFDQKIFKFS